MSADGAHIAYVNGGGVFVYDIATGRRRHVSQASDGTYGNGPSSQPAISSDGNVVAFTSSASNLVQGDTNHVADVFVHDLRTGQTTRVSVSYDGRQANGISAGSFDHFGNLGRNPVGISADGRVVAFASAATNLEYGDTNRASDVFIHDLTTGLTSIMSVPPDGAQANGASTWPSISGDGQLVAFSSTASNLVQSDTNNGPDIFVRNFSANTISMVSADAGSQFRCVNPDARISTDGSTVAFAASNDCGLDQNIYITAPSGGDSVAVAKTDSNSSFASDLSISGNGRYVSWWVPVGATYNQPNEFDRVTRTISTGSRISEYRGIVSYSEDGIIRAESWLNENPASYGWAITWLDRRTGREGYLDH